MFGASVTLNEHIRRWALLALDFLKVWVGRPYPRFAFGLLFLAAMFIKIDWVTWVVALIDPAVALQLGGAVDKWNVAASLVCVVLASLIIILDMRAFYATAKPALPPVIAVRHRSFDGAPHQLTVKDVPAAPLIHEEIDQTHFYSAGQLVDPAAALRVQASFATRVRTHMLGHPGASLAYYGKAHIPLIFAAGYAVQVDAPVQFFELNRGPDAGWRSLASGDGPELGLTVDRVRHLQGGDVSIRISISYAVGDDDVKERLAARDDDIHIRVAAPRIDCITHRGQVDAIARVFREELDQIQSASTRSRQIHVFCAAPVSVVFALGRMLSPTIHAPVIVHNFSQAASPRYAWGVQMNGLPAPQVVRADAANEGATNVQSK